MNCACGHHHTRPEHDCKDTGSPIDLARPMTALQGRLICADTAQMMTALSLLSDHADLSRGEPGCLRFDLWQDEDPLIWNLSELFVDADAFAAHQSRTADSDWGRASTAIRRDFDPERRADHDAIDTLLRTAFDGEDEARLVRKLRANGDLHLSLVAVAAGTVLGHVALSPVTGDRPALALAPVAVAPGAQRLGIGAALVREAIRQAAGLPVVVLGDPAYYARFGFLPADLSSLYAGPYLQMVGDLPAKATIRHAAAFADL